MSNNAKAYHQILEISDLVRGMVYKRTMTQEIYIGNTLNREALTHQSSSIDAEFAQMTFNWVPQLSNPAKLFVFSYVIPELKYYNLLWHRPITTKSSEKAILRELLKQEILFKTETAGIYIVNPFKVWRGTIPGAVEATKELLREHKRPSLEIIKDLRPKRSTKVKTSEDMFNELSDNNFSPNMLEEPEAPYDLF